MARSKSFWLSIAAVCFILVGLSAYSIYARLTLHMTKDRIAINPPPKPDTSEKNEPAETAAVTASSGTKTDEDPAAQKQKAVKTVFEYKSASAKNVLLSGSFTTWKEVKMQKKNGLWKAEVYILPGNYLFHFVVDGKKTLDPSKPKAPIGESIAIVDSNKPVQDAGGKN